MTILLRSMILMPAILGLCGQASADGDLERALALLDELDSIALPVEYADDPLGRVLEDLSDRLGVPVRGDWPALDRLVVDEEDEVTYRLARGTGATVLAGLTLALADEFERPTFECHAGRIILTTFQGTAAMRLTDVYDVRDLLQDGEAYEHLRQARPAGEDPSMVEETEEEDPAASESGGSRGEDESPDDESDPAWNLPDLSDLPKEPAPRPLTPGEELITLITEHIDPEAWINYGGSLALITERDGVVMVTAPHNPSEDARDALDRLRRVNPRGLTIEAFIIDVPPGELARLKRRYGASSAMLGRSLLQAEETILLWRSVSVVAMDQSVEIESRAGEATISLVLKPTFEKSTGSLSLMIEARMNYAGDDRSVHTTVAIAHRNGGAVLELPPANPAPSLRLLILIPQRM